MTMMEEGARGEISNILRKFFILDENTGYICFLELFQTNVWREKTCLEGDFHRIQVTIGELSRRSCSYNLILWFRSDVFFFCWRQQAIISVPWKGNYNLSSMLPQSCYIFWMHLQSSPGFASYLRVNIYDIGYCVLFAFCSSWNNQSRKRLVQFYVLLADKD